MVLAQQSAAPASVTPDAGTSGLRAAPPSSTTEPLMGIDLDARYVNDDQGEVGSADIIDGSLTGGDVSTSSGNVFFNNATVTARKGTFGVLPSATGSGSTVSGGSFNQALGNASTVSGGSNNEAAGLISTISGGDYNSASGYYATVSGGTYNSASGNSSTVSGGGNYLLGNTASGDFSTVPGGGANTALGAFSFAAGRQAKANHAGSFVWGDSVAANKTSSAADQFNVFAEGGARIFAVGQATPSMVVDASGNVGVGSATPGFKLEVNGSAHRVDNSSTWTVTSDARLKKNVHDLEGALETLLALRGVSFEYKDPASPGLHRGFLAQEVEEVLPEWVEDGPDGYKRLTMNGFEALAVEAFRAQEREIGALRAENEDLRDRITALEALGSGLEALKAELDALASR